MIHSSLFRATLMTLLSLLLTAVFFPLAAAPMMLVRRLTGRSRFVIQQVVFAVLFFSLGHTALMIAWLSLSALVFFLEEALLKGHSLFASGFYGVLGALFAATGLFTIFNASRLVEAITGIKAQATQLISSSEAVVKYLETYKIEMDTLLMQIPSLIVVLLIIAATLALLFGGRSKAVRKKEGLALNQFTVPNEFIFVLIASLAGSFLSILAEPLWISQVATNLLNVCVLIYGLQGAAVVARFFELYKVSLFWKIFAFFILLVQLPIVLSFVGFMDYWFNFRSRFQRKIAATEEGWRKQ